MVSYNILAGYVVRTLKLKCGDCAQFVADSETHTAPLSADDLTLVAVKDRGGLIKPHTAVIGVCLAAERSIRLLVTKLGLQHNIHQRVVTQTLSYVLLNNTHAAYTCAAHSTSLIKMIIERYSLIRIHHETSKLTNTNNTRSKLNRIVIFSHL